ncbi:MAG: T9SS type A sorting domain-containing protein [Calditrichaeota bacterium]|nr:T9SS type A sorting domain-containing protein [Calditrichota bacterium]
MLPIVDVLKCFSSKSVQMDRISTPFPAYLCALVGFLCFVMIVPNVLVAQTEVEGEVSGVWDVEGSPYLVMGSIIIPRDQMLTIEPGVVVSFETSRDSVYVYGEFQARGTEEDSIVFQNPPGGWSGFHIYSQDVIGFEYCNFETLKPYMINVHIEDATVQVDHCQMHLNGAYGHASGAIFTFMNSVIYKIRSVLDGNLTIRNCHLTEGITCSQNILIEECTGKGQIRIEGPGQNIIIRNNTFTNPAQISVPHRGSDIVISDNHIDGDVILRGIGGVVQAELLNNEITGEISLWELTEVVISGNKLYGREPSITMRGDAVAIIERNLLVSVYCAAQGEVSVRNNVFIPWNARDYAYNDASHSTLEFYNNIIYGDGVCSIIKCRDEREGSIHHNLYWGISEPFINIEPGENNIETAPLFIGGREFDYNLQAISPAKDAGDPDSPEDPDGTRADIGRYFFDRRFDHNPVIASPLRTYAKQGGNFSYSARGSDDGDEVNIDFLNLPDWLRVVERDDGEGSVTISGEVPEMQTDFSFGITVTDDNDQMVEDVINVEATLWTVLRDTLPELVESVNSPFRVVGDIFIPEDQITQIEPGCEFRFIKYDDHNDMNDVIRERYGDVRFGLNIDGGINATGTEEEPIIFRYEGDNPGLLSVRNFPWQGIAVNAGEDSIVFSYCVFQDGKHNLNIAGRNGIRINSCELKYCGDGRLFISDSQNIEFSNNNINEYAYRSYGPLFFVGCRDLIIERNIGSPKIGSFTFFRCCNAQIIRNDRSGGISLDRECENFYIGGNRITGLYIYDGGREITIENNTIDGLESSGVGIRMRRNNQMEEIIVRNNIITGQVFEGISLPDEDVNLLFENNNVWGNLEEDYPAENIFDIGRFVDVNVNGDSVDVYGNFSTNPKFIGFGPYKHNLQPDSPCIDAGHPDFPEDPDGSISDVGWHSFNHDNVLPELVGFHPQQTEFDLSIDSSFVFSIDVHDQDGDSLTYLWTLDHKWIDQNGMEYSKTQLILDADNIEIEFDFPGQYQLTCEYSEGNGYGCVAWDIGYVLNADDPDIEFPQDFKLEKTYPNPFNSSTNISYSIPHPGNLSINFYDLQGRNISQEVLSVSQAGRFSKMFDLSDFPTGVYFVEMGFESVVRRQKLVLIR